MLFLLSYFLSSTCFFWNWLFLHWIWFDGSTMDWYFSIASASLLFFHPLLCEMWTLRTDRMIAQKVTKCKRIHSIKCNQICRTFTQCMHWWYQFDTHPCRNNVETIEFSANFIRIQLLEIWVVFCLMKRLLFTLFETITIGDQIMCQCSIRSLWTSAEIRKQEVRGKEAENNGCRDQRIQVCSKTLLGNDAHMIT